MWSSFVLMTMIELQTFQSHTFKTLPFSHALGPCFIYSLSHHLHWQKAWYCPSSGSSGCSMPSQWLELMKTAAGMSHENASIFHFGWSTLDVGSWSESCPCAFEWGLGVSGSMSPARDAYPVGSSLSRPHAHSVGFSPIPQLQQHAAPKGSGRACSRQPAPPQRWLLGYYPLRGVLLQCQAPADTWAILSMK